jgi:chromosomal replication initiator protein
MDANDLWTELSEMLRTQVSEATWRTWFEGIRPVAITNHTVILAVPSTLVRERLEGRYESLLNDALSETVGSGVPLRFVLYQEVEYQEQPAQAGDQASGRKAADGDDVSGAPAPAAVEHADQLAGRMTPANNTPAINGRHGRSPDMHERSGGERRRSEVLNSRYTFDSFVIGSSNRFAAAAALAVAEMPGRPYNPLFIYGDAGLGKTHLLQAIGNYVCVNFPSHNVRYVSTETFLNELVEAIRIRDRDTGFKRRYRECDVLLVDDVQFIEGRNQLQEELFHTFNTLFEANKQVVFSSDRPPRAIGTIEERLRSRFMCGLITEVQLPELETRIAILRTKAERERVVVNDDVLEFIASNVKDNIRELEGALIRVTAFANLDRKPLTLDLAQIVLADIVDEPRPVSPDDILLATEKMFGFSIEELCGHSRRRPLVVARQISMYVFRQQTDFSYPAIAKTFGGRDHTTVIHAVEKISTLMKEKREIYDRVTELTKVVKTRG